MGPNGLMGLPSPSRTGRDAATGTEVPRWEVRTLINSLGRGSPWARQGNVESRTACIKRLRGLLSELGIVLPLEAATVRREAGACLEDLPANTVVGDLPSELHRLDERIAQYDAHLQLIAREDGRARQLMRLSGVGPTTATAIVQNEGRAVELRDAGARPARLTKPDRLEGKKSSPTRPCAEIDRPPWHPGSHPQRLTPITLPAAASLPLRTPGARRQTALAARRNMYLGASRPRTAAVARPVERHVRRHLDVRSSEG